MHRLSRDVVVHSKKHRSAKFHTLAEGDGLLLRPSSSLIFLLRLPPGPLPLSIQHDLWRQKKMPCAELWRSSYDPETFGQNQCMKNTCEFLIHTVRSPPRITVGPDGEAVIDGFRRVLCLWLVVNIVLFRSIRFRPPNLIEIRAQGSRFGQNSPEGNRKRARPKFLKSSSNGCTNTLPKSPFSRRILHFRKAQILDLDGYGHHQKPELRQRAN